MKPVLFLLFLLFGFSFPQSDTLALFWSTTAVSEDNAYTYCHNNVCTGGYLTRSCNSLSDPPSYLGYAFIGSVALTGRYYGTGFSRSFACPSGVVSWQNGDITCGSCCNNGGSCQGNKSYVTTAFNLFYIRDASLDCDNPQNALDSIACNIPKGDPAYCATTESAAQIILASRQAECYFLEGELEGSVSHEGSGDYCVEVFCNPPTPSSSSVPLGYSSSGGSSNSLGDTLILSWSATNRVSDNEWTYCENNCCTGGDYGVGCQPLSNPPSIPGYVFLGSVALGGSFSATGASASFSCPSPHTFPSRSICWAGCTQNGSFPSECQGNASTMTTTYNLFYVRNCANPPTAADSIACNTPKGDPAYCAVTESDAQALLAARQASCNSLGGDYFGAVAHKESGDYCVEDSCDTDSCPDDSNGGSFLQKKSFSSGNSGSFFPNENAVDYRNGASYEQGKPNLHYDALGRRTEPRLEIRRRLFEAKRDKTVTREIEPAEGIFKRERQIGECCVESFNVGLVNTNSGVGINTKFGIEVEFNASFYGEEHNSVCNPSCCEFKQDTKGFVIKNNENKKGTTCEIGDQPVYLNPFAYVPDCYGRGCDTIDGDNNYNDALGTYNATDFPGVNNIKEGDALNMRMEFNSYIKDRCNAYEVKEVRSWGFRIHGVAPGYPDTLEVILLGVLGQ
jgi:hypothetical protein